MADDDLVVVVADDSTKTLRSVDRRGKRHQVTLIGEMPEIVPTLTGAQLVYTVGPGAVVPLVPPTGGADFCRIRAYQAANDGKRLFFRKDGTNPTNDGANAEGYILHMEGMSVKTTFANFKMIVEAAGGNYTVYVEWLNSST